MITLLITIVGSLTLVGSLSYLFINKMGLVDSSKSLNQSNSGTLKLKYHDDPNAFRCRINPMKDIYFINVHELRYINKLPELSWINRYGVIIGNENNSMRSGYIASNSKDELKELVSDILKERIDDPDYPNSIRVDFMLPDEFVCYGNGDDITIIHSSEVESITKLLDLGCIKLRTYSGMHLISYLETHDEYMDKQNELNRKKESDRLNGILKQLENINKL